MRTNVRYGVRMNTSHLGTVVSSEMEAKGITKHRLSILANISRATLDRRLASGAFTAPEIIAVATALQTKPSRLMELAEQAAA